MEREELPAWGNINIIKRVELDRLEEVPGWQSKDARKGLTAANRNDCTWEHISGV